MSNNSCLVIDAMVRAIASLCILATPITLVLFKFTEQFIVMQDSAPSLCIVFVKESRWLINCSIRISFTFIVLPRFVEITPKIIVRLKSITKLINGIHLDIFFIIIKSFIYSIIYCYVNAKQCSCHTTYFTKET